jgi:hydrogenase maturation protein HypF
MIAKNINSPLASSAGRLFDAVAASVGICRDRVSYEGQGAIELEAMMEVKSRRGGFSERFTDEAISLRSKPARTAVKIAYPFDIITKSISSCPPIHRGLVGSIEAILESRPMWQALLKDLQQGVSSSIISTRFHLGLAEAIASMVRHLHQSRTFTQIALTGGVFQNLVLLEQVSQRLNAMNFTVLTHSRIPANDGGLSLGQIAIAAARSLNQKT